MLTVASTAQRLIRLGGRVRPLLSQGANAQQAGNYAATLRFLKTVKEIGPEKAKGASRATVACAAERNRKAA